MKIKAEFKVRDGQNRRINSENIRFPLIAGSGEVVLRDRWINPDRRHPGLETHEVSVSPEEFDQLFQEYAKHQQ